MSETHQQRVRRLFDEVVERPTEERTQYLAAALGSSPEYLDAKA